MKDILLNPDGDLFISETGDIKLTDSIPQAVRIRLKWFFGEWRFAPLFGVPYFEEILIKNPNKVRVRSIMRDEVLSVDEVIDAQNIVVAVDNPVRSAVTTIDIVTTEENFRQEVPLHD